MKGDAAMKKILFVCLLVLALFIGFSPHSSLAFMPQEFMVQSANQTADAYVVTEAGFMYGIWVSGLASGVTVTAYDVASGTTSGATTIFPTTYLPLSGANPYGVIGFDPPVPFYKGIAIDIIGTGAITYKVYYRTRSN